MNDREYSVVINFESSLVPNSPVMAKWTNNGTKYYGMAAVVKVNKKSIRVRLTEDIIPYRKGREISVPSIDNIQQWTANNRVEPLDGYKPITVAKVPNTGITIAHVHNWE